ncbi:uncharacterized protein [Dysidea avara]|uniref:uncharacterized protein isoform X2 n=1 Tax=Dysidea avara TaxID=196820 RepID=UPI0033271344
MAASDPANLAQALATIASAFALNQNNTSGVSTAITNSPVTVAVNSAPAHTNSTSPGTTNFATGSSTNSRPSSSRRRRDVAMDRKPKKAKVIKQWDRDVLCLPPRKGGGVLSYPRGKYRAQLADCGLIGKLHMTSVMEEEDVAREIRSIFKGPMKDDANFQFQYLQSTGGGSKSLTIPAQSESFKWTAYQVARLSGQSGTIYILALDELDLKDSNDKTEKVSDDSDSDDDSRFPVGPIWRSDMPSSEPFEEETPVVGNNNATPSPQISWRVESYNNFISLLSSDSEDDDSCNSPTSPNISLLTPPRTALTSDTSIEVLLRAHCSEVLSDDRDDVHRIKARRRHIWEDVLSCFKRGFPVSKHLRVTFLGEPAVDAGGPLREFFHLLLGEICGNNSLFCGPDTARVPLHNVAALTKQTFKYIGYMIGASLVNGGPSPSFFANIVADYILYGIERTKVKLEDVVNLNMQRKLTKLLQVQDEESFVNLMDSEEYNFRYECGICQPSQMIKFNQREEIVSALAMHTIYSIKAELDQIISGLDGYGLGKLAQDNPEAFRPLLVYYKPLKLSADAVHEMFPAGLSALGSNTRDAQEAALMHWVNYTQAVEDCQGTMELTDPRDQAKETFHISLEDIVVFATGMAEEPPMGFLPKPSLVFHSDRRHPRSNTCANEIGIPVQRMPYEEFAYNMTYGILNTIGFGFP